MKISETHLERAAEAAAQGGGEKQSGLRGSFASCIAPHISENRHACIAKGAYFYAKYRGFAPGHELDDWLAAETTSISASPAKVMWF